MSAKSKPKGIVHSLKRVPYSPKSKVGVYHAADAPPTGVPHGRAVRVATVEKDSSLKVRLPKKGSYLLAAESEDGGVVRFEFTVD